jgi:hypothetical protein
MRTGTDGGVGIKPGDRYVIPLCTACHPKQHRIGELTLWSALRIDPLNVALRLWTVSADLKTGEPTVFRARQQIDLAKAMPKDEEKGDTVRCKAKEVDAMLRDRGID